MPIYYRVQFVALVSFLWTIIFSEMRGNCETEESKIKRQ